jgi:hypothetical protein
MIFFPALKNSAMTGKHKLKNLDSDKVKVMQRACDSVYSPDMAED